MCDATEGIAGVMLLLGIPGEVTSFIDDDVDIIDIDEDVDDVDSTESRLETSLSKDVDEEELCLRVPGSSLSWFHIEHGRVNSRSRCKSLILRWYLTWFLSSCSLMIILLHNLQRR